MTQAAALLHDVAKHLEKRNPSLDHGDVGAEMAEGLLRSCSFDEDKIKRVCYAIRVHNKKERPVPMEAEILYDADTLDKLGAVGIATVFVKACLTNNTIEEVVEMHGAEATKPSYLADHVRLIREGSQLYTKTARNIAQKRVKFFSAFFRRLKNELESKDFGTF